MNKPKCEFCLTKIENRKISPERVFCMTLWREVDPYETCFDCASNQDFKCETEDKNEN